MQTKPIFKWISFKLTSIGMITAFAVFGLVACNNGKDSKADEAAGMAANNPIPDSTKVTKVIKKKGKTTVNLSKVNTNKIVKDNSGVYNRPEVMPQFPGGQKALGNYVNDHLDYPQQAIDNNTGGTVMVSFVVDEKGKVSHAKILGNKVGDGLDEQALKVVNNMPEWTPGKVHGRNVKTRLELPIAFQVES